MRLWVLGSGSSGNAILLEAGDTRILIDAGFFPRTLAMRLRACGATPESVQSLIITHEHADHMRGAAAAASRWGWETHASIGTVRACPALANAHAFRASDTFSVGNVKVQTVRIAHDAADPV
ncbi:MAG TPA: MBL fold metallo-hydrolase, partial [Gemmatimonadaceae bacterium]|nr:MBL fold metallo-hydrolase [Gemmatimonadaceae bacterium]